MNTQDFRQLPTFVQYLVMHGLLDIKDMDKVMEASHDAIKYNLQPGDLWRIDTDRGMAS